MIYHQAASITVEEAIVVHLSSYKRYNPRIRILLSKLSQGIYEIVSNVGMVVHPFTIYYRRSISL
jgi:hypothetical protein